MRGAGLGLRRGGRRLSFRLAAVIFLSAGCFTTREGEGLRKNWNADGGTGGQR
jgi:hypothetical protein